MIMTIVMTMMVIMVIMIISLLLFYDSEFAAQYIPTALHPPSLSLDSKSFNDPLHVPILPVHPPSRPVHNRNEILALIVPFSNYVYFTE